MDIYISKVGKAVPIEEAIELLTDDVILNDPYNPRTIMDLRDAIIELTERIHKLQNGD